MPRTSSRHSSLPRGQSGIQSFARATKPGILPSKTLLDGKQQQQQQTTTTPSLTVSPSKKRKLNELENVDCGSPRTTRAKGLLAEPENTPVEADTPSKTLHISELSVTTPRSGHYASPSSARVRCETSVAVPGTPSKRGRKSATPRGKPAAAVLDARPACVHELLNLHAAFLKALTIHAAHHGALAAADLREFLHSVERLWKKRKVVIRDLQRLIWVWEQGAENGASTTAPRFRLANYGLGRVCLERVLGSQERRVAGGVDESELQEGFEQTVGLLWEKAVDAVGGDESKVDFMATLGLVSVHESLTPFTTFRKGQQRLQDLKGGVIKLKTERLRAAGADGSQEDEAAALAASKTPDATSARRVGLLDRIRDKALRQSKLPPPPSKEVILRGAAAQRVEEVVAVLSLLRPAGYVGSGPKATIAAQRTPFQLCKIVQNVQDSVRNPISEKEVEICLDILSQADVAGQWINLVTVNQVKSVVLKSCADVNTKEIAAKVSQLKAASEAAPYLDA